MANGKKSKGVWKGARGVKRGGFTELQKRFVREYLADPCGSRAARKAGYSAKTAEWIAQSLLKKPHIAAAIAKGQKALAKRLDLTAENILRELARVGFADIRRVVEFGPDGVTLKDAGELTDDDAATIAEVGQTETKVGVAVRLKQHDKLRALRMLGEHLRMFATRHEITGKDGGPLEVSGAAVLGKLLPELAGGGTTPEAGEAERS